MSTYLVEIKTKLEEINNTETNTQNMLLIFVKSGSVKAVGFTV